MRLLLHFARFGPYHHARLRALAELLGPEGWEVTGLETASTDITYAWDEVRSPETSAGPLVPVRTVFPGRVYEEIFRFEYRRGLIPVLEALAPDAVAVAGWGTVDARSTLRWCRKKGVKAIIMSETREIDGHRVWWKEKVKSLIMRKAHGAVVGGRSHRDYLVKLGIPAERIRLGYNVVDNAYFTSEAARWRSAAGGGDAVGGERSKVGGGDLAGGGRWAVGGGDAGSGGDAVNAVAPYFLASNRFIDRKNLVRLIEAYALYCQSFTADRQPPTADGPPSTAHQPWSLCLLGDGPLRERLFARCHELGLNIIESAPWEFQVDAFAETPDHPPTADRPQPTADRPLPSAKGGTPTVFFPGFRQIGELPHFYATAGAFIHPALEEPWGLVINEAMASGLPVLSGSNVGAAAELIEAGCNGWTFDAWDCAEIAAALRRLSDLDETQRRDMGLASREILERKVPTAAFGTGMLEILNL
jgi:glycosyltransferase involved in cell wall biosynthesis